MLLLLLLLLLEKEESTYVSPTLILVTHIVFFCAVRQQIQPLDFENFVSIYYFIFHLDRDFDTGKIRAGPARVRASRGSEHVCDTVIEYLLLSHYPSFMFWGAGRNSYLSNKVQQNARSLVQCSYPAKCLQFVFYRWIYTYSYAHFAGCNCLRQQQTLERSKTHNEEVNYYDSTTVTTTVTATTHRQRDKKICFDWYYYNNLYYVVVVG